MQIGSWKITKSSNSDGNDFNNFIHLMFVDQQQNWEEECLQSQEECLQWNEECLQCKVEHQQHEEKCKEEFKECVCYD